MSLINDMLKDLDRRRLQPAGAHGAVLRGMGLAPAGAHALRILPAGRLAPVLALLCMAVVLAITLYRQHAPADAGGRITLPLPAAAGQQAPAVTAPTVPAVTAETAVTPSTGTAAPPPAPVQTAAAPASPAPANTTDAATEARIEVNPRPLTREQREARDLQAAVAAIGAGDLAGAETQLLDLLEGNTGLHEARLLLAGLYLQQQRSARAESLLATGLLQFPQHAPYARLYGQLLTAQARDSEAINVLQNALPNATGDAGYHALLAGLYQRNGRPADAVAHYRAAVRLTPEQGAWWTGLGISSEQTGDTGAAVAAYRRALQQALEPAVESYVQERLGQLTH